MVQCIISLLFSDFFFSTIMIPRKRPEKWFRRPGFLTRKVFLVKWIFVANVFSLGYRSTLLSTLVPIRYEETIDTVYDLDKSRLSLLIPKDTAFHELVATDTRPIVRRIYERSTLVPFNGTIPKWVFDRHGTHRNSKQQNMVKKLNL